MKTIMRLSDRLIMSGVSNTLQFGRKLKTYESTSYIQSYEIPLVMLAAEKAGEAPGIISKHKRLFINDTKDFQ